jgi:hypothetical protein
MHICTYVGLNVSINVCMHVLIYDERLCDGMGSKYVVVLCYVGRVRSGQVWSGQGRDFGMSIHICTYVLTYKSTLWKTAHFNVNVYICMPQRFLKVKGGAM